MREIKIPSPTQLPLQQPDGTEKVVDYDFTRFLNEHVWNQPEWRQDENWLDAYERLVDAYETAVEGGKAVFYASDIDFEKFLPLASLKGKAVAPTAARAVNKMTAPAIRARYVKSPVDMSQPAATSDS